MPEPALFATGLQMVIGGLILLVASVATGELNGFDWGTVSTTSWLGVLYLLVVGSLVGYTTYAWLLTVAPLPRIATYAYVKPGGRRVPRLADRGRALTARTAVAAVVIVVAVVLIVTARGRAARPIPDRVEVLPPPVERAASRQAG